jgi:hypothetical protein
LAVGAHAFLLGAFPFFCFPSAAFAGLSAKKSVLSG